MKEKMRLLLKNVLENRGQTILGYNNPEQIKNFKKILHIKKEVGFLMSMSEAYNIHQISKNVQGLEGNIAEVGVFKGGSAKIICEAEKNKKVFLFDTFEGLPSVGELDKRLFSTLRLEKGQYAHGKEGVKKTLNSYENVVIHEGLFPQETGKYVEDEKFCFVNLDVDTYEGTKSCLEFFYPKMVKGGVMLCHDYTHFLGVQKAVNEVFTDKPECVFNLCDSQCMIIKLDEKETKNNVGQE